MEEQKNNIARKDEDGSRDQQATPSRAELEQHVRARAWKDEAFRQEFQANPKTVLERDYAQWFPEGKFPPELSIKVIEEEEQTIYFVLPPRLPDDHLPEMEDLDEEELEAVSGGIRTGACTRTCFVLTACFGTCRCNIAAGRVEGTLGRIK